MNEITKELLDALKMATLQNQLDMLMTVEELRKCESAIAKAEAILAAPQPANDGWIPWPGGDCPVESDAVITVKLRKRHINGPFYIVAYRVAKP